jgi:hypothetical protein
METDEAKRRQAIRDWSDKMLPLLRDAHRARADPAMSDFAAIGPVADVTHIVTEPGWSMADKLGMLCLAYAKLASEYAEVLHDEGYKL